MTTRARAVAAAVGAAVLLGAVVVGVPLLLLAVGSPFHAFAQAPDAMRGGYLPDDLLLAALAVVGWFLWAEFTLLTILESVAAVRGRTVGRVPAVGGLQRVVARLVATVTLAGALAHPSGGTPRPLPVGSLRPAVTFLAAPAAAVEPPAAVVDPAVALPVYTVRPHDDLWSIADTHLGNPLRWREIWQLNRGQPMSPHGEVFDDENLIRPGWVLTLPADAAGVTPATPDEAIPRPVPPAPAAPAATTPPVTPPATIAVPDTVTPTHDHRSGHHGHTIPPAVPAAAATLTMVLAGVVIRRLDLLRRAQLRRRRPGRRLPGPSAAAAGTEVKLRAIAAIDAVDWIDAANRMLTGALTSVAPCDRPEVVAVRAGTFGLEVLLDRVAPAPDGFVAADAGHTWRLDPALDLGHAQARGAGCPPAVPALVTVGASPEGPVLVNLAHLRVLQVEGDATRAQQFLAGVALELAAAPWSLDVPLHVDPVLPLPSDAEPLHRDATGRLADRARRPPADGFPPDVVVAAGGVDVAPLVDAASPGGAVVVVHGADAPGTFRLRIDGDGAAVLEPLGLRVHAAGLALEDAAGASELLHLAECSDGDEVIDLTQDPDPGAVALDGPAVDPEVWVQVLGPVAVSGWAAEPERAKVTEIVVLLAMHTRPMTADALRTALWPDGVSDATFRSALSRSRRKLGTDAAGADHLSLIEDGRYRLGPAVACDWHRFRALTARARAAGEAGEAIEWFRQALTLVRGEPFAEVVPNTYGWAWGHQHVSAIEVAVTDAAAELGRLALESGDAETAAWAADRGLAACPGHEALYQLRMTAAAAAGDVDGVDRAYRDALHAAQAVDPLDDVAPETHQLHEQLRGHTRGAIRSRIP